MIPLQDCFGRCVLLAAVMVARWLTSESEIGDGPIPKKNEVVMTPGMSITATTGVGEITIEAGKGLKRSFTWEGATRSVEMIPRTERWYGSMGLYNPGSGDHWKIHNGISRCVVSEGQRHYATEADALKWIRDSSYHEWVWRNDGLLVGWSKTLPRRQLTCEVWQIMIDGKKPMTLEGSQDEKIVVKSQPD